MKPVYKYQAYIGTLADIKNLEIRFSEMAEKGWMIDKIDPLSLRYREVEPCKKRFFVDLLPQITVFDYPENEDARDYRGICEDSGWTFVTASRQLHIFCADRETPAPPPIHTDNRLQAKIYLKVCRRSLLSLLIIGLFFVYNIFINSIKRV